MTAHQIDQLVHEIEANVKADGDLSLAIHHSLVPLVIIGRAMNALVPGLAGQVNRWVEGNPPTLEELDDLRGRLTVLSDTGNG